MSRKGKFAMALVMLVLGAPIEAARADSLEAMCEVVKHGDSKEAASGPCTFSQRQGYINLGLRNGDEYSLSPSGRDGHYKDQRGHAVVRTIDGDGNVFKWDSMKVTVTFDSGHSGRSDAPGAACEVRRHGDVKKDESGACSFSQRRGEISVRLRNGDEYTLVPGSREGRYKDQQGREVVRTASVGSDTLKWDSMKITVTFGSQSDRSGRDRYGDDAADRFQYLVNGSRVGGEVDDEMQRQGFKQVATDASGNRVWGYYQDKSNGECVVVQFNAQRVVKSVARGTPSCHP